jgi:uncharacterized membrane protein
MTASTLKLSTRDAANGSPGAPPHRSRRLHFTAMPCLAPIALLCLAGLGLAVAFYVAQASYSGRLLWAPLPFFDGSNIVAQSPYARVVGIPLSFLGVMYYAHMLGLAGFLAYESRSPGLRTAALVYTGIGVAYSLFSLYIQGALIGAFCVYCIVSGVVTLLLFLAALRHFLHSRAPAGR